MYLFIMSDITEMHIHRFLDVDFRKIRAEAPDQGHRVVIGPVRRPEARHRDCLDPVVRDEVLDLLYDFMQDENHAILLSSHITSDLDKIADEITFIHKGEVLLSEPRDELLDTCGILRCTADQLNALDPSAVRAKRVGTFGCEALVRRDGVPENWSVEPVNIEQIMLFLTRGEDAR